MKRNLLLACFFLSGATGLVYEVLWARILGLSFGHTVWAVTTILAVFMGGLALGSWVFGRVADRVGDPVRLYALLELGTGLYCLAAPSLLDLGRQGQFALLPFLGDSLIARTALQFLVACLVLVVPTTLMGGTVPAVAKAVIAVPETAGKRFGIVYGTNTMGAAAGAFAAGYWLLPSIGITITNLLAAIANISIGAGLLLTLRAEREDAPPSLLPMAGTGESMNSPLAGDESLLRLAFFLSGGTAMIFQVAWVRSLILVIGSSTYAYSAILVTVLFGIALGSIFFSKVRSSGPALAGAILAGIAASVSLTLPFFDALPGLYLALFKGFSGNYAYIQFVQFLVVFPVILLPSVLMGMLLPCLTGMIAREGWSVAKEVGRFYAANTAGAIAGSVLAGFVLIPGVGAQKAFAAGIILEALMATVFLIKARPGWRVGVIPMFAGLSLAVLVWPAWDKGVMNLAVAVYPDSSGGPANYHTLRRMHSRKLLFAREGISSNVAVFGDKDGARWFTVNGKTDGGTGDMGTQVKLAMFPMLLSAEARRVAVIGLGTGVTAATTGLFEEVESIDVVELEPAVVEAAAYFERENGGILSDPRVRLHLDDGRSFFESRRGRYDVIISEPSNPWIHGVSNLYTVEFFRGVRENLAPGGLFGLWVQAHMISLESYRLIARTFMEVFPDATLWQVSPGDTLFLGGTGSGGPRYAVALRSRLHTNPRLSTAFGEQGGLAEEPLVAGFLIGPQELRRFAGGGGLNSDDRNLLEFSAPRSVYRQEVNRILREVVRQRDPFLPPFLMEPEKESPVFHLRAGERHNYEGNVAMALWEFNRVPSLAPPPPVRMPKGPFRLLEGEIKVDFDGPVDLPFIPFAGSSRPEEGDEESTLDWQADIAHLTRTGGVIRSSGRGGSTGLLLRGIRTSPCGYFIPVEVGPANEYEVRCWMMSVARGNGTAGVKVLEYDDREEDGAQPTAAFETTHFVRGSNPPNRRGGSGWTPVSFRFRTSPTTTLVRIFFFLDGARGDSGVFDDIALKRIR
jgi:spermidine synthase